MLIFAKPTLLTMSIGFLIALIGELIRFLGVCYIGSESRTTGRVGGTKLMVSGPFAYVRNPLYIGNILIYSGIGIMSNALFPYLLIIAVVFFVVQYYMIIIDEEEYLRNEFKEDFEDYFKNVNRFFPKCYAYKKGQTKFNFDFKKGVSSEKRTIQGFSISVILLIFIWSVRHYG
jgi:protein-S-isoprenylcysteine O-methyltransferase Ste14